MITHGFTYVAVLLFMAAILITLEEKSSGAWGRFFSYVPAVVLCYLLAMALCSINAWDLDATKPTYDALKTSLTYTMVFTMLLRCDLRKIMKLGSRMLIGFFSASVTVCISFVLSFAVMQELIGSDAWKALGALCGSWIGGSGNMVALQTALNISESDMAYVLVMDSIDYSFWVMFLLWAMPLAPKFNQWTRANTQALDEVANRLSSGEKPKHSPVSFQSLFLLLGCGLLASALGQYLGTYLAQATSLLDESAWTVLTISLLGLLCAVSPLGKVSGASELSNILLYSVIALLASRARLSELANAPIWLLTGLLILAIHAILMVIFCKLFKIDLFTAAVASLANIGGTASAPVLAGSYASSLVPVGILMALMGYIIGTPCGILAANLMHHLIF